ncbi:hypothetical protein B0H19DRAFT_409896 [Mycena capillaripes]|nr:hypothetical protein B0H19DRAFT_409896 [Mycena capillaripes]
MKPTTAWQEITVGATRAFRAFVPEPELRVPLTWINAPAVLACFLPFVFLAYLARRPGTYYIRLLVLPTVIVSTLSAGFRYKWTIPELNVYNWAMALLAEVVLAKAWLYDSFELIHTTRGLRWKFAQGTYIPAHTRPLERRAFLRATLDSFIQNFLLLDLLESCIKLFPGVGVPAGGSMFYHELPLIPRYIVSTTIHMLTGSSLLAGFGMVYDLITLVAVGLLDSAPTSWPPVLDHPWRADSLHTLWARSWHQLLRNTFLVFGGYPGRWLAGDVGMLLGTFLASGLFHECSVYTLGRGFDHSVTLFFAAQGPLLIGERLWRKVLGKRVGGRFGRIWVYFVMFIGSQPMVNAWHVRGLGGAMVIPPLISPVRITLGLLQQWGIGRP